ncbi:MAG: sodium-dependent transporter [Candidatus Cloacimonetes bacterium]|nr:sodium-dependent transporter [Candidatus Cloacimonadota bacterium]
MVEREHWSSRKAFILAAIGSAIGLGNIWRFPFKCYENGGGAFLVAYLVAMLTAGIPILILELSLGHRFKLAAPLAFAKIKKKFEWIGWWAVLVAFMITTYYAVVMAWGLNYTVFSISQSWGVNTADFFYQDFLGLTQGPFELGGVRIPILLSLIIGWILIVGSIWKGAKTVSKVVYLTVFLPWILLIVFVIRGLTLPGSMHGVVFYLQPHFEKLLAPGVWIAAYGQVFYSLSIGFGIMIAYASFLPKDADIVNSSLIIALSDGATAFIGGFAVFGALGYYAQMTGQAVTAVLKGGPGLAFVTYPEIINNLPLPKIFGFLFFLMLLTLAVDSAFSLVEAVASSVRDKFNWSHAKSNLTVSLVAFFIGVLITTGAGLYWLDIMDKWLEVFGLSAVVLVECIVLSWFFKLEKLRKYCNAYSEVKVGVWWTAIIKYFVPLIISALIVTETVNLLIGGYGGYPPEALFMAGWRLVILLPVLSVILANMRTKGEISGEDIIIPRSDFKGQIGYDRLNRYIKALALLGIILIILIDLSSFIPILNWVITISIGIYIFLALIGGAVYFTVISLKDEPERLKWAKENLPGNE